MLINTWYFRGRIGEATIISNGKLIVKAKRPKNLPNGFGFPSLEDVGCVRRRTHFQHELKKYAKASPCDESVFYKGLGR